MIESYARFTSSRVLAPVLTNQRFAGLGDGLEERDVRQVARCDLVAGYVDPLEEFDARKVERGRKEDQVQALRELLQVAVLRLAELERLAVRSVGRSEAFSEL